MKKLTCSHKTILAGAVMLMLLSCQSSSTNTNPATEALLTSNKGWKISAIAIAPSIGGITDYFNNILPACNRDNIFTLTSDGKYTIDEGATKCDSADPQIADQGKWSLSADKKTIIQTSSDPNNILLPITIVSITSTTFIHTAQLNLLGTNYVLTSTLTAIK